MNHYNALLKEALMRLQREFIRIFFENDKEKEYDTDNIIVSIHFMIILFCDYTLCHYVILITNVGRPGEYMKA